MIFIKKNVANLSIYYIGKHFWYEENNRSKFLFFILFFNFYNDRSFFFFER